MSTDNKNSVIAVFDFIGQVSSILLIPIVCAFWYVISLKIDNVNQAQQILNQLTFATKIELKETANMLQESDAIQREDIQELEKTKEDKPSYGVTMHASPAAKSP